MGDGGEGDASVLYSKGAYCDGNTPFDEQGERVRTICSFFAYTFSYTRNSERTRFSHLRRLFEWPSLTANDVNNRPHGHTYWFPLIFIKKPTPRRTPSEPFDLFAERLRTVT